MPVEVGLTFLVPSVVELLVQTAPFASERFYTYLKKPPSSGSTICFLTLLEIAQIGFLGYMKL